MRRTIRYSVTHTQARALVHDLPNSHDNSILIRPFRGFRRERRVGHACNLRMEETGGKKLILSGNTLSGWKKISSNRSRESYLVHVLKNENDTCTFFVSDLF